MRRLRVVRVERTPVTECAGILATIPQYGERPLSDLNSSRPIIVSRRGMNALISKDLTAPTVGLLPIAPSVREALIATAPYYPPEFRENLAEDVCASPFATDVIDAPMSARYFTALAPGLKPSELTSRPTLKEIPRTEERCQHDVTSVEGLAVESRRPYDQSKTAGRATRHLLAGAHRDLRDPLTALLRLNSDWDFRRTDSVAQRMIEQQRQALEVMTDLIDGFLTIAELETAGQPTKLADLASPFADGKPRETSAKLAPRADTWSAAWSMQSAVDWPESPVVVGPASRARRVLLIDEDQWALGALRIYLLCTGYRVFAAASADEALDLVRMARMGPSLIDIVIADLDVAGDDDGIAAIDKTRRLAGYNVPAVLLMDQASIEIGMPALAADVSRLRKPVNVDELNVLISEMLKKRPKALSLVPLRAIDAKLHKMNPAQAPLIPKVSHEVTIQMAAP
jgi:CheY-like chemotaxis protein